MPHGNVFNRREGYKPENEDSLTVFLYPHHTILITSLINICTREYEGMSVYILLNRCVHLRIYINTYECVHYIFIIYILIQLIPLVFMANLKLFVSQMNFRSSWLNSTING